MKIIDALWEKRNLGINTTEIIVDREDSVDEMAQILCSLSTQYQVLKLPCAMIEHAWTAESKGFRHIETIMKVSYDLSKLIIPPALARLNEAVSYSAMSKPDIEQLFEEIRKGMFQTDRVSLDPYFTPQQSAYRYVGWLQDEIERGSLFYKYIYKDSAIGFFTLKHVEETIFYPFLAGMYLDFQKSPLGAVYLYKPLLEAKRLGGKAVNTYFSLNNYNAARMHINCGFAFVDAQNVYVKHL